MWPSNDEEASPTWWLVGDLSEDPDLPGWLVTTSGLAGAVLVLVTAPPVVLPRHTRSAAIVILVAGAIAALLARVMTAGVVGANIGGGMALLFGMPVVLLATVVSLVVIGRRTGQQRG